MNYPCLQDEYKSFVITGDVTSDILISFSEQPTAGIDSEARI